MEHKGQNSFVLYTDYIKHISLLSDQEAGQLFKALFHFAENGTVPEFSGSLNMCFSFVSSQMQRDKEKYIDICEKRAEAGRKGGKQKQANLASANYAKQNLANLADNDTVNDSDTVSETDINYICSLLNQAKAKAGSKGRLKPQEAFWYNELFNIGISYEEIKAAAEELADIGKDVNWYSFDKMLRNGKTKGGI